MSTFLKECFLQKTNQYDALKVLEVHGEDLKIGKLLTLLIDKDDNDKECVFAKIGVDKIGCLSDEDSKVIRIFLKARWNDIFECRICKVDEKADENKRYSIVIKIKDHEVGHDE